MRTQWLDAARLSFKGRVFAAVCSLDIRDFEKQPNGDDTCKRQKSNRLNEQRNHGVKVSNLFLIWRFYTGRR